MTTHRLFELAALVTTVALFGDAQHASAQVRSSAVAPQCGAMRAPGASSDSARRAARDLASRAREASILADSAKALALYAHAASLDPADASVAYALGRSYEAISDKRATGEYCRFLALSPSAPEAADVRLRLAALAAPPAVTEVAHQPLISESPPAAFAVSFIFPGLGQYTTHQPALGLFFTAATLGAIYYGVQAKSETVSVTKTATDPFGNPYQYQSTEQRSTRPNVATGFGAAAGLVLVSAIEAYAHARGESRLAAAASFSRVLASRDGVGLGVRVPIQIAAF